MANELLPCPFCGGPAEIYNPFHMIGKPSQPATYRGGVRCRACGCESKATTPPDGAITTWNRRADATPQASAVAGEQIIAWDVQDTGLGRRYTTYNPKIAEDLMNLGENVRPLVYASALPPANAAPQASAEPQQYTHAEVFGPMESAWNAALDQAAAVAKRISDKYAFGHYGNETDTADEIEREILDLKQPQADKDDGQQRAGDEKEPQ